MGLPCLKPLPLYRPRIPQASNLWRLRPRVFSCLCHSLLLKWQEVVFALYLTEGKIQPEVVENMRSWKHTGFTGDQSVYLPAGDKLGIERLVQYITRCHAADCGDY